MNISVSIMWYCTNYQKTIKKTLVYFLFVFYIIQEMQSLRIIMNHLILNLFILQMYKIFRIKKWIILIYINKYDCLVMV